MTIIPEDQSTHISFDSHFRSSLVILNFLPSCWKYRRLSIFWSDPTCKDRVFTVLRRSKQLFHFCAWRYRVPQPLQIFPVALKRLSTTTVRRGADVRMSQSQRSMEIRTRSLLHSARLQRTEAKFSFWKISIIRIVSFLTFGIHLFSSSRTPTIFFFSILPAFLLSSSLRFSSFLPYLSHSRRRRRRRCIIPFFLVRASPFISVYLSREHSYSSTEIDFRSFIRGAQVTEVSLILMPLFAQPSVSRL